MSPRFCILATLAALIACDGATPAESPDAGHPPPPPPPHLAIQAGPASGATDAPFAPALEVAIVDDAGRVVTTATQLVTVSLSAAPAGANLSGTRTAAAVAGRATFSDLSVDLPGSYTLAASSPGLAGAESAPVFVRKPARLVFMDQPQATGDAGAALTPMPKVALVDAAGDQVPGVSASISVALGQNPAGGTLSGTRTLTTTQGTVQFAGLSLDKPGSYTLAASTTLPGVTGAVSSTFTIRVGPPASLAFTAQPQTVHASLKLPDVKVAVRDVAGNLVTTPVDVNMAIGKNPGSGTLAGVRLRTTSLGVATFTGLSIDLPAKGYTLVAAIGQSPSQESTAFEVQPGAWAVANGGLFGGSVISVTVEPQHGDTIFATTTSRVWRSADRGASWSRVASAPACAGFQIAYSPAGTDLYLNCLNDVYVSHDGGATWQATAPSGSTYLTYLTVAPSAPATLGGADAHATYVSSDGGATWNSANFANTAWIFQLAFHPTDAQIALVAANDGVYGSGDGGKTWQKRTSAAFMRLAFDPRSPTHVYATNTANDLYVSQDGGTSFSRAGAIGREHTSLLVDPSDGDHVLMGVMGGVYESRDGGTTIHLAAGGLPANGEGLSLAADAGHAGRFYLGTVGLGFFGSDDSAVTWQERNQGLAAVSLQQIAIAPGSGALFALSDNALYRSLDAGLTWRRIFISYFAKAITIDRPTGRVLVSNLDLVTRVTQILVSSDAGDTFQPLSGWPSDGTVYTLAVDPTNPAKIYVGSNAPQVSIDGGVSFHAPTTPPLGRGPWAGLAIDPAHPATVYAQTYQAVARSLDGGDTWTDVGLPSTDNYTFVMLDPFDGTPYVGAGGNDLLRRWRGGVWSSLRALQHYGGNAMAFDPTARGTLYLLTNNTLCKTKDDGATWADTATGLPAWVWRSFAVDPTNPMVVYVAGEGGVFKSTTAGE